MTGLCSPAMVPAVIALLFLWLSEGWHFISSFFYISERLIYVYMCSTHCVDNTVIANVAAVLCEASFRQENEFISKF